MEAFSYASQRYEMNTNFTFVDKSKNKFAKKFSDIQKGKNSHT